MIGFETIGSAICIVYDAAPVLTTDAWTSPDAYFGSWTQDYEIPAAQRDAMARARFHWFSHGHPDHLNAESLRSLGGGRILLSNHRGARIRDALTAAGFSVTVLPDRRWIDLSPNVAVYSMPNQNQDSILLIRVGNTLIIDKNDSPDFGAARHVRRIARHFSRVYMLALHCWGAVDMINVFDGDGHKILDVETKKQPLGPQLQAGARAFGGTHAIPFSSFHRFQRVDSAWANELIPSLADYHDGATSDAPPVLPAFVRVDCRTGDVVELRPPRRPLTLVTAESCGDVWSDDLTRDDRAALDAYFQPLAHVRRAFGFLTFVVGRSEHTIALNRRRRGVGIRFEVPHHSLMLAVRHGVFDDLLIGNYMRVHLHNVDALYPDFTPYVAKYGDNGLARSRMELLRYFGHYAVHDPFGYALQCFHTATEQWLRPFATDGGPL
jgi:hypothetical protein